MKKGLLDILRGKFLVSGDAPRNWLFIIFASTLATVMIASSHSADRKVHQVAALNEEVRELRSEFVEMRSDLQRLKLESTVMAHVEDEGLLPSEVPPRKIRIKAKQEK